MNAKMPTMMQWALWFIDFFEKVWCGALRYKKQHCPRPDLHWAIRKGQRVLDGEALGRNEGDQEAKANIYS